MDCRCRAAPGSPGISTACWTCCGSFATPPALVHRLDRDTSGVLLLADPGHRREAGRAVPRAGHREDLLGGGCRPPGSGGGPHRPAAETRRGGPRGAYGPGRTRRSGGRVRSPTTGPWTSRAKTGMAGTEAADRAHPSVRVHCVASGRRSWATKNMGTRSEHGLCRDRRGSLQASFTCTPEGWCFRIRPGAP